jgi:putative transposase
MSRKADCYDNAPMDLSYAQDRTRPSPALCNTAGSQTQYLRHSAIGYISPIEMELKAA